MPTTYAPSIDLDTLADLDGRLEAFTLQATERAAWLSHDESDYYGLVEAQEFRQLVEILRQLRKATRAASKLVQARSDHS